MNLVIDIGNTIVKTGLFDGEKMLLRGTFSTHPGRESDEWGIMLMNWLKISPKQPAVGRIVISSVAQSALLAMRKATPKYFGISPVELTHQMTDIPILCDDPRELGADRIANAVAVNRMYRMPAVVVDFGTATTFDVISRHGEYVGGVIAPGIHVASESLWQKAERLFPVEFRKPDQVIGKNTADNLVSGIFYTCLGMVKEILDKIEKQMGQEVNVIATGGWGKVIGLECEKIKEINPDLTLQGLNFIAIGLQKKVS